MAGNYCVQAAGQTKARVGVENVFELVLPEPVTTAPTGTITIGGTTTALVFSGCAAVEVQELIDGRRVLVLSSDPSPRLSGTQGQAWLVSSSIQWGCTVQSFAKSGQSYRAQLADPLPADIPSGERCYLYFGYWCAALPVQAHGVRNCLLSVEYAPVRQLGQQVRSLSYLVDYVAQVFSTGLTEEDLRRRMYTLNAAPSNDAGYSPAMQAGEDDLIQELRYQLAEKNLTEDDVPATSTLRTAHELYAASQMFRVSAPDTYAELQAQAKHAVEVALRNIWLDANRDGAPDEEPQNLDGPRGRDLSFGRRRRFGVSGVLFDRRYH